MKLTEEQLEALAARNPRTMKVNWEGVVEDKLAGMTHGDIAKKHGCSKTNVSHILRKVRERGYV